MSVALIVNPASSRATLAFRTAAAAALRAHDLEGVHLTTASGHAGELAAAAVEAGATVVVAMGGDGTASEVAAAVADTDAMVAPLPLGSTNVFARSLGWPRNPHLALEALVAALADPHARALTLGRLEAGDLRRTFLFNAGWGVDADAVHLVEAHPRVKRRLRQGWFAAATVASGVRIGFVPPRIGALVDGEPTPTLASLIVACGSPYTFLGPRRMDLVPDADFDGRLAWLGLLRARPDVIAGAVAGALRGGRHIGGRGVASGWASEAVQGVADRPVALQADGEPLGRHAAVRLTPGPSVKALHPPKG